MRIAILAAVFSFLLSSGIVAAEDSAKPSIPANTLFTDACKLIPEVPDACTIAVAAATFLAPTYEPRKATDGERRLSELGYVAQYYPARSGLFGDLTDAFLIAERGGNRVYLVITGTESGRDWIENAKAKAYTSKWRDGYYYTPPGHAGFRSGALNVIRKLLVANEFDQAPLAFPTARSELSRFLCRAELRPGPDGKIGIVLAGHSRGAAIAQLLAPALSGYEMVVPSETPGQAVAVQGHWPLRLDALVGFAMPISVYTRTDDEAGLDLAGKPDQWDVYGRAKVAEKSLIFLNERDIVPLLSLGLGAQLGHQFRLEPSEARANKIFYSRFNSANALSLIQAHGSGGYCEDVLKAFGADEPDGDAGKCDERTFSQPPVTTR